MTGTVLGESKVCRSAYAVDRWEGVTAYMGRCETHDRPVRVDVDRDFGPTHAIPCPEGDTVLGKRLNSVTTKLECDGSCRSAFHSECVCGCGGMNHGISWLNRWIAQNGGTNFVTGAVLDVQEVLDETLARWRARQRKIEAARRERQATRETKAQAVFDLWADQHEDLIRALDGWYEHRTDTEWQEATGVRWGAHILVDFAIQTHGGWNDKPKPLSDKQIALAFRILGEGEERKARQSEREANAKPVPTGRVTIDGTIVKVKASEGYSYDQVRLQMTVAGDGFAVMMTLPTAIAQAAYRMSASSTRPQYGGPDYYAIGERLTSVLRGASITVTANVEASGKDPSFGFGKRPSVVSWELPGKDN